MSLLLCPLCGKFTSWAKYDPSGFEMDVKVRELKGLGRGKGFKVLGEWSLLEDNEEALLPMSDRLIDLMSLFHEHGLVSTSEIRDRFGPEEGEEGSYFELDGENDEECDNLVDKIADAIEIDADTIKGETPFERVKKGVSLLINEYLSATEEDA